jgi:hypothetical protein
VNGWVRSSRDGWVIAVQQRVCDGAVDWSVRARGSMGDQQRATAFIWEFGLHIGQLSMHAAAMQLGAVDAMLMYVRSEQRRSRSAEGSVGVGVGVSCALSFCPPLQHFSATSSPPPQDPVIPSAPHRLRKAEDFACSVRIESVAVAV